VLTVFGMFAKKMIDPAIAKGANENAEIQWAVGSFMNGMGLEVGKVVKLDPDSPEVQQDKPVQH
jgi:hypothetical protein